MQNRSDSSDKTTKKDEYKLEEQIGRGAYGTVFSSKDPVTGKAVVVKKIDNLFFNSTDQYEDVEPMTSYKILREIKLLRMLKSHPNIVSLHHIAPPKESQENFNKLSLVFEKMDCSLFDVLKNGQVFDDLRVGYLLFQLLCGVNYLHSANIIHRDLKPANLLVNGNCLLKICDFGLSRIVGMKPNETTIHSSPPSGPPPLSRQLTPHVVTRWYRAPELMVREQDVQYGSSVDMWSVGCILAELLMTQKPNKRNHEVLFAGEYSYPFSWKGGQTTREAHHQLNLIINFLGKPTDEDIVSLHPDEHTEKYLKSLLHIEPKGLKTLFPYVKNEFALDLLGKCLVINPKHRITAEEALQHPFLDRHMRGLNKDNEKLIFTPPTTVSDQKSFDEYYAFERELESLKINKKEPEKSTIRRLIWEEVERYNPSLQKKASEEKQAAPLSLPTEASNRDLHKYLKLHGCFRNNQEWQKESSEKSKNDNPETYRQYAELVAWCSR